MSRRPASKRSKGHNETCLAYGKPIRGVPRVMRLQITHEDAKLAERAKVLGFASLSRKQGDFLEGLFDQKCFKTAILIWQAALHTRLVSPRR